MTAALILALCAALLGSLLAFGVMFYEQRSMPHWLFAAGMTVLVIESIFYALTAHAVLPKDILYWQNWRLVATSFLPGVWLVFSLSYARGNYREVLKKRKFLWAAIFLVPIGIALLFRNTLLIPVEKNEWVRTDFLGLGLAGFFLNLLFLVCSVLILMNLERTYRASVGTMRWRIKFMILGLGVLFAVRIYSSSQVLLFHSVSLPLQRVNSTALLVACLLMFRSLVRTGNFNVIVYPSQSILHNSFTVLLAGAYLLGVGVLTKLVTFLGGDSSFAFKAFLLLVCLVFLSMLLLSDRVRLIIKRFVSRHFQRPIHDYRSVWRTFTDGTARCVEQSDLCQVSVNLVADVFQALSVTVWLVNENKAGLVFGASTALSEAKARLLNIGPEDARQVISALSGTAQPVDIDSSNETWAVALRHLQPEEFRNGGNRICVPMMAGGELVGVLMIGDRVGGVPFLMQDFDLLRSVSDQAAASLLNIQLAQKLSQAKQLEAFQAMSSFFVHDLKNTASMLSLMLQNLPIHFNDPQFREDALRGVSKTVTHINDLIGRLGLLRQGLALKTVESDLNSLVAEALTGLQH
ncbi:MAG: GAF domain-containing protein, partial [Verrucomicrobiota bacterium]